MIYDAAKIRFMRHHFNAYLTALDNQRGPVFFTHMTCLYFETFGYAPMHTHFDGTREDEDRLLTVEELLARQRLTKRVGQQIRAWYRAQDPIWGASDT
ncbi:hypothetical protein B0H13DRAFT_2322556 [Mycena leptocephala]|nr:hypothetical protein B0H13DRAFT_2322556 [Mycena leptocephala]